ncbi:universal stress protein, partial [Chloroflexota bacterium]
DRERLVARLTGRSSALLCFGEMRDLLRAQGGTSRGIRKIRLDAVVGSMERCSDFTRSFLPLKDNVQERWTRVLQVNPSGLPPIETYQIGDVHFVSDGHHRVSVARHRGLTHILASVSELQTRVPLAPDVQSDELAVKAEYAGFLERTRLDESRPELDLGMTVAGQYGALAEQIQARLAPSRRDGGSASAFHEAAVLWYDEDYLPDVRVLRERDIQRAFPNRTEADLFLWLCEHRAALGVALGWSVDTETAADDLARRYSAAPGRIVARARDRALDAILPGELHVGPHPGTWRREREIPHVDECLFGKVLVPISGEEGGWSAVAQAAEIACREQAQLLGLHVVPSEADVDSERVSGVRAGFDEQCKVHGVPGTLSVEAGKVARTVTERSRWADLVVAKPQHAPPQGSLARLGCGFHTLVRRSVTPVLAVPGEPSALERPLLAYDGTPMAREALFVAAYLALRAQTPLVVVAVAENNLDAASALSEARAWLEQYGVQAEYIQERGPVAAAILRTSAAHDRDLIVMGGYGHSLLVEVMLGSTVDDVLRASPQPVLICR